ncbi:hypothetical protein [Maribacter sp. 2304DJ31-5]|uniref:hypothetical protein n=1 Tax=Maribacter sp. 2304DJ31-5 TaxID=3386273 RepID=UPI0039BCADEA
MMKSIVLQSLYRSWYGEKLINPSSIVIRAVLGTRTRNINTCAIWLRKTLNGLLSHKLENYYACVPKRYKENICEQK